MQSRQQLQDALKALKEAYNKITVCITVEEIRPLKGKILSTLQREVNQLATQLGEPLLVSQLDGVSKPQPLRSFLGRPIGVAAEGTYARDATPAPVKTMTAEEVAVAELRAAAEILYAHISTMQNDTVVDTYTDLEIRAVAKLAGLPVTEDNPKTINVGYIDKIKAAIAQRNAPPAPDKAPQQDLTEVVTDTENNQAQSNQDEANKEEVAVADNKIAAADTSSEASADSTPASQPEAQPAVPAKTANKTAESPATAKNTPKNDKNKGK